MDLASEQRDQLARELEAQACADLLPVVQAHAQGCLSIRPTRDAPYASVGHHRLGGDPDLPPDFDWPARTAGPFVGKAAFIGQVRLDALPARGPLPETGLLSVFCFGTGAAAEPVEVAVQLFADCARLERRGVPAEEIADEHLRDLTPVAVEISPAIDLDWSALLDPFAQQDPTLHGRLSRLRRGRPKGTIGQLLGFPLAHDDADLRLDVALTAAGRRQLRHETFLRTTEQYRQTLERMRARLEQERQRKRGKPEDFSLRHQRMRIEELTRQEPDVRWWIENRARLLEEARRWHPLLRVDSNRAMNLSINDVDPLFVFAHESELRSGRFARPTGRVLQG